MESSVSSVPRNLGPGPAMGISVHADRGRRTRPSGVSGPLAREAAIPGNPYRTRPSHPDPCATFAHRPAAPTSRWTDTPASAPARPRISMRVRPGAAIATTSSERATPTAADGPRECHGSLGDAGAAAAGTASVAGGRPRPMPPWTPLSRSGGLAQRPAGPAVVSHRTGVDGPGWGRIGPGRRPPTGWPPYYGWGPSPERWAGSPWRGLQLGGPKEQPCRQGSRSSRSRVHRGGWSWSSPTSTPCSRPPPHRPFRIPDRW
jgi:hypothetical protein